MTEVEPTPLCEFDFRHLKSTANKSDTGSRQRYRNHALPQTRFKMRKVNGWVDLQSIGKAAASLHPVKFLCGDTSGRTIGIFTTADFYLHGNDFNRRQPLKQLRRKIGGSIDSIRYGLTIHCPCCTWNNRHSSPKAPWLSASTFRHSGRFSRTDARRFPGFGSRC